MNQKKEIESRYPVGQFGEFEPAEVEAIAPFMAAQIQLAELTREITLKKATITESQSAIESARADYDRLIDKGLVDAANATVKAIPEYQKKNDAAKSRIAEISQELHDIDAAVSLDGDSLNRRILEAEEAVKKMRLRLMSITELAREVKTGIQHLLTATESREVQNAAYVTTSTGD